MEFFQEILLKPKHQTHVMFTKEEKCAYGHRRILEAHSSKFESSCLRMENYRVFDFSATSVSCGLVATAVLQTMVNFWHKATVVLLCLQVLWVENLDRSEQGQLGFSSSHLTPQLGRLEVWGGLNSWGLEQPEGSFAHMSDPWVALKTDLSAGAPT